MFWIKETLTNEDEGYIFGEGYWVESDADTLGELFKRLQSEYGRCVSKQYSERHNAADVQSGWVFEKISHYEDTGKPFKQHTWVSVSSTAPQKRTVNITRPWDTSEALCQQK